VYEISVADTGSRIRDPEWGKIRIWDPEWEKSGIQDKHPESATLHFRML